MGHPFLSSKSSGVIKKARSRHSIKHSLLRVLAKWIGLQLQPQIWSSQNQYGEIWWHIYNPNNGQTVNLASVAELQMWLEQHARS